MINNNFKIAVVSNDGIEVSKHFGSAPFYEVFTIENGVISKHEKLEKFNVHVPGMQHQHHQHSSEHDSGHKHSAMIENILDCKCLISRGMGYGIYQHLENANIEPIITDIRMIEDAVKAVIDGSIVNHSEKLH